MMVAQEAAATSVNSSLEELANLLIVLHDSYLGDAEGSSILQQLMRFLHDLNLTEVLCILDVEHIRLKVMSKDSNEQFMSYESFYEWLREASCLVFRRYHETGAQALNLFLTRYIIPFATKEKSGSFAVVAMHTSGQVVLSESSLRVLMPYGDFLHLWFTPKHFDDSIRLSPIHNYALRSAYQAQPTVLSSSLSIRNIFETLRSCGIFPEEKEASLALFKEMVMAASAPRDSVGAGEALNCLAFPGFLCIIESIAAKVALSEVQALGMGQTLATRLIVLLQRLTEHLLDQTFKRFLEYEGRSRISSSSSVLDIIMSRRPSASPSLAVASMLWLARQVGLTQIPGLGLNALLDELLSRADTSQQEGEGGQRVHAWSIAHLPHTLQQIAETYMKGKAADKLTGLTGISSEGRVALLLAQHIPAILFASPVNTPIVIAPLYQPSSLRQLHTLSPLVDCFFRGISALPLGTMYPPIEATSLAATSLYGLKRIEVATFRDFSKLCSLSGVTPYLLSAHLVRETCEHILGFHLDNDALDVQVCKNDWIEILYVLAQICFCDADSSSSASAGVSVVVSGGGNSGEELSESMQKLSDLLKCFDSVSHLPQALSRVRQGSDLQSYLAKTVMLKSAVQAEPSLSRQYARSIFSSELVRLDLPPIKMSYSPPRSALAEREKSEGVGEFKSTFPPDGVDSEEKRERGLSGCSLRQIMIALMHYPCNSFALTPWTLLRMLTEVDKELLQGTDRVRSAADDSWLRIAGVFKIFCLQFHVSSADLTSYFAGLYKEDYYVADTPQMLQLRDVEGKYGMPPTPFLFDGQDSYSNKVKVVKPAVQGVMASPVFDLLFLERVALLLSSHSDLLCWEFSRACALLRFSDPFTRDLKSPLPSARSMKHTPQDCRMTVACALNWAEEVAGVSGAEATLQLKRTLLLSGGSGIVAGCLLTYSIFLAYAIHCFSAQALLNAPMQSRPLVDVFESCIIQMVRRSAALLESVQQSLQLHMDVLKIMYTPPAADSVDRMSDTERVILARHALEDFDKHVKKGPSGSKLPPRPPPILWDASRFLEFCCFYGLVEATGSLMAPVRAFKTYLSTVILANNGQCEDHVLALMPIRVSPALVLSLLDEMARESSRGVSSSSAKCDMVRELLPIMLSVLTLSSSQASSDRDNYGMPLLLAADATNHTRGGAFEDIVRYGGDEAMISFVGGGGHLLEAYQSLVLTSLLAGPDPESEGAEGGEDGGDSEGSGCGEALLSVVCTYLSCCGLIPAGKIAKIAKRSLHSRLRPIVAAGGSSSEAERLPDIVTVSFAEFEEMSLRCAFSCWESSGALTGLEPSPVSLLLACTGSKEREVDKAVRDAVYKYCIEGMRPIGGDWGRNGGSGDEGGRATSWGADFVGPYLRTLLPLSPLPHQVEVAAADREIELENMRLRDEEKVREMERRARQMEEELRIEQALQARMLEFDRAYVDSYMSAREPSRPLVADTREPEPDQMQVLLDKTECLQNPSLGINVLLDGTKEELWPVYATYCSCGDSTDPGKLSGPNLFTLLSKLGILNDRTVLSDVGMLLHQISAHLHAQSLLSLASLSPSESIESPSLSFEQFLVFLCAYSQLFFDAIEASPPSVTGVASLPPASLSDPAAVKREAIRLIYAEAKGGRYSPNPNTGSDMDSCSSPLRERNGSDGPLSPGSAKRKKRLPGSSCLNVIISSDGVVGGSASASRAWLAQWREYMNSSCAFRSLLEDYMLPVLWGHTLLAFPDDARLRDKYAVLFSLEVLLALQSVEPALRSVFLSEGASARGGEDSPRTPRSRSRSDSSSPSISQMTPIISALTRINLVPQVVSEARIKQLMKDVMPERLATTSNSRRSNSPCGDPNGSMRDSEDRERERRQCELLFPHWEWVVCVVAYEAMDSAVRLSSTKTDPEKIPCLIAELIESIAGAMASSFAPIKAS